MFQGNIRRASALFAAASPPTGPAPDTPADAAALAAATAAASAIFSDARIAETSAPVIRFWNEEYIPDTNGAVSGPDTWPPEANPGRLPRRWSTAPALTIRVGTTTSPGISAANTESRPGVPPVMKPPRAKPPAAWPDPPLPWLAAMIDPVLVESP